MGSMSGKVAVVTGAGKGGQIGYDIARAFASAGAKVVLVGRNKGRLGDAVKAIESDFGVAALAGVLDFSSDETLEASARVICQEAGEAFGRIDVLVNALQVAKAKPFAEHTMADLRVALETGVGTTFAMMQACYPFLKERGGSVINLASGAGMIGQEDQASLAAAKEAVRGLSRVAAREWAELGITVNVVCPLAMTNALEKWAKEFPQEYQDALAEVPMGRYADAQNEVGETCVFLASDAARFITGETLCLQGGRILRP